MKIRIFLQKGFQSIVCYWVESGPAAVVDNQRVQNSQSCHLVADVINIFRFVLWLIEMPSFSTQYQVPRSHALLLAYLARGSLFLGGGEYVLHTVSTAVHTTYIVHTAPFSSYDQSHPTDDLLKAVQNWHGWIYHVLLCVRHTATRWGLDL